uniref:Uncharacterized protein n=1 Tax=Oryza punctata TaxID=4537 RepID=A0A0E0JIX4_ORYPU
MALLELEVRFSSMRSFPPNPSISDAAANISSHRGELSHTGTRPAGLRLRHSVVPPQVASSMRLRILHSSVPQWCALLLALAGLLCLRHQRSPRLVFHPFRRPSSPHLLTVPKPQPPGSSRLIHFHLSHTAQALSSPHPRGAEPPCRVLPYPHCKPYLLAITTNSSIGNSTRHLRLQPSPLCLQGSGAERRSQGAGLLRDSREDRGSLRSRSLVEKGSKRLNHYMKRSALRNTVARLTAQSISEFFVFLPPTTYTANSMGNARSSRPQLSVITVSSLCLSEVSETFDGCFKEAIFTVVKDLGTDLQNSPSEIVGYSSVKVVSLE